LVPVVYASCKLSSASDLPFFPKDMSNVLLFLDPKNGASDVNSDVLARTSVLLGLEDRLASDRTVWHSFSNLDQISHILLRHRGNIDGAWPEFVFKPTDTLWMSDFDVSVADMSSYTPNSYACNSHIDAAGIRMEGDAQAHMAAEINLSCINTTLDYSALPGLGFFAAAISHGVEIEGVANIGRLELFAPGVANPFSVLSGKAAPGLGLSNSGLYLHVPDADSLMALADFTLANLDLSLSQDTWDAVQAGAISKIPFSEDFCQDAFYNSRRIWVPYYSMMSSPSQRTDALCSGVPN
jgi:hypothetical protein